MSSPQAEMKISGRRELLQRQLADAFRGAFPDAKVVADPGVLNYIMETRVFVDQQFALYRTVTGDEAKLREAIRLARSNPLAGNALLSMMYHFGQGVDALTIEPAEGPKLPGQEVEKNLLLGVVFVDGNEHFIFIEHEWKMDIKGAVIRQIHLHARVAHKQKWEAKDQLSVVVFC